MEVGPPPITRVPVEPPAGYRLEGLLGQGAMGAVYRAFDEKLGRAVALKFLVLPDAGARARFQREAQILARLTHPNIVRVLGFDDQGEKPVLVSELVEGADLASTLRSRGGPPAPAQVIELMAALLDGLAHAHQEGIVHRDLKPENLLLSQDGQLKITDFGLAAWRDPDGTRTGTGVIMGTPHYMAPEQGRGQRVDARADLYSAGVILFELATGRLPFPGGSLMEILRQHQETPPPDPRSLNPQLSEPLAELVLRCLEKDADRRWPSALELRAALLGPSMKWGARRTGSSPVNRPASGRVRVVTEGTSRRRGWAAAGGTLLVLGLGGAGWFSLRPPGAKTGPSIAPVSASSAVLREKEVLHRDEEGQRVRLTVEGEPQGSLEIRVTTPAGEAVSVAPVDARGDAHVTGLTSGKDYRFQLVDSRGPVKDGAWEVRHPEMVLPLQLNVLPAEDRLRLFFRIREPHPLRVRLSPYRASRPVVDEALGTVDRHWKVYEGLEAGKLYELQIRIEDERRHFVPWRFLVKTRDRGHGARVTKLNHDLQEIWGFDGALIIKRLIDTPDVRTGPFVMKILEDPTNQKDEMRPTLQAAVNFLSSNPDPALGDRLRALLPRESPFGKIKLLEALGRLRDPKYYDLVRENLDLADLESGSADILGRTLVRCDPVRGLAELRRLAGEAASQSDVRNLVVVEGLYHAETFEALEPLATVARKAKNPEMRRLAIGHLIRIGGPEAAARLEQLLVEDLDERTLAWVIAGLGLTGDQSHAPKVLSYLASSAIARRTAAAMALGMLAPAEAGGPLIALVEADAGTKQPPPEEFRLRQIALWALGEVGGRHPASEIPAALERWLQAKLEDRGWGALALGRCGTKQSLAVLEEVTKITGEGIETVLDRSHARFALALLARGERAGSIRPGLEAASVYERGLSLYALSWLRDPGGLERAEQLARDLGQSVLLQRLAIKCLAFDRKRSEGALGQLQQKLKLHFDAVDQRLSALWEPTRSALHLARNVEDPGTPYLVPPFVPFCRSRIAIRTGRTYGLLAMGFWSETESWDLLSDEAGRGIAGQGEMRPWSCLLNPHKLPKDWYMAALADPPGELNFSSLFPHAPGEPLFERFVPDGILYDRPPGAPLGFLAVHVMPVTPDGYCDVMAPDE